MPGNVSRWNAHKDLSFEPVRPELVAEIAYEQLQSGRLRHGARLLRWRPDRDPASCRYDQLEQVAPVELHRIFGV
jgi:ATP-dependent DNA ligase